MLDVLRIPISKADLLKIPASERSLFLLLGYASDQVNMLWKLVIIATRAIGIQLKNECRARKRSWFDSSSARCVKRWCRSSLRPRNALLAAFLTRNDATNWRGR
jgi:hypothetical protein